MVLSKQDELRQVIHSMDEDLASAKADLEALIEKGNKSACARGRKKLGNMAKSCKLARQIAQDIKNGL
jgi:CBS-domain-containing membrane protein